MFLYQDSTSHSKIFRTIKTTASVVALKFFRKRFFFQNRKKIILKIWIYSEKSLHLFNVEKYTPLHYLSNSF